MTDQAIDYDALANQARGTKGTSAPVDYDALANQARGVSAPASSPAVPAAQGAPASPQAVTAPSPAWYDTQLLHPDTWFGLQQAAAHADPKTPTGVFLHALHGAAQSVGQMSTAKNAAIVGGLGLANLIPVVGEVADGAVLGLGAKGIFETGKDVYDKTKSGDVAGAEESLGQGIPNAVGTAYAGFHGVGSDATLSRSNFPRSETSVPARIVGSPLTLAGKAVGLPAPSIAESALGVTAKNRMYSRDPGTAILNDTSGFAPSAVQDSAEQTLASLRDQSKAIAKSHQGTVSLQPALDQLMNERTIAESRNDAPLAKDIDNMFNHLGYDNTTPGQTGTPIPVDVPAEKAIDLLHGFRQQYAKYNSSAPLTSDALKIGNSVAHTLSDEVKTVPGIGNVWDRMSNLIPVKDRADITERSAPFIQEMYSKLKAPTGALIGAAAGFHEGGIPGALLGLATPALFGNPAAQMFLARALHAGGKGLEYAAPHVGQAVLKLPAVQQKHK